MNTVIGIICLLAFVALAALKLTGREIINGKIVDISDQIKKIREIEESFKRERKIVRKIVMDRLKNQKNHENSNF